MKYEIAVDTSQACYLHIVHTRNIKRDSTRCCLLFAICYVA